METMETKICERCGKELPLIGNFKQTRWGHYCNICNGCVTEKLRESTKKKAAAVMEIKQKQDEEARTLRLADFTPRELMQELARRGYEGKLSFTRVETIDITNF